MKFQGASWLGLLMPGILIKLCPSSKGSSCRLCTFLCLCSFGKCNGNGFDSHKIVMIFTSSKDGKTSLRIRSSHLLRIHSNSLSIEG